MAARKSESEARIVGMPRVWQARFTGCRWLVAYWETHCSLLRWPNIEMECYADDEGKSNEGVVLSHFSQKKREAGHPIEVQIESITYLRASMMLESWNKMVTL
jgi:hypothetical protein